MIISKWPDVGEIGVDIRWREDVLEAISFRNLSTFLIVLGEDENVRILIREMLIRSMTLDKLIHRDLGGQFKP